MKLQISICALKFKHNLIEDDFIGKITVNSTQKLPKKIEFINFFSYLTD